MSARVLQENDDPPPLPFQKVVRDSDELRKGLRPSKKADVLPISTARIRYDKPVDREIAEMVAKMNARNVLEAIQTDYIEELQVPLPDLAQGTYPKMEDDTFFLERWLERNTPVGYTAKIYTRPSSAKNEADWVELIDPSTGVAEKFFAPKRFRVQALQKNVRTHGSIKLKHGFEAVPDPISKTKILSKNWKFDDRYDWRYHHLSAFNPWNVSVVHLGTKYFAQEETSYRAAIRRKAWKRTNQSKKSRESLGKYAWDKMVSSGNDLPIRSVHWLCKNPDGEGLLGTEPTGVTFGDWQQLNFEHECIVADVLQYMDQSDVDVEQITTLEKQGIPPVELRESDPQEYRRLRKLASLAHHAPVYRGFMTLVPKAKLKHLTLMPWRPDVDLGVHQQIQWLIEDAESLEIERVESPDEVYGINELIDSEIDTETELDELPFGGIIKPEAYSSTPEVEYEPGASGAPLSAGTGLQPVGTRRSAPLYKEQGWTGWRFASRFIPTRNSRKERLRAEMMERITGAAEEKPSELRGVAIVSEDGTVIEDTNGDLPPILKEHIASAKALSAGKMITDGIVSLELQGNRTFNPSTEEGFQQLNRTIDDLQSILDLMYGVRTNAMLKRGDLQADEILAAVAASYGVERYEQYSDVSHEELTDPEMASKRTVRWTGRKMIWGDLDRKENHESLTHQECMHRRRTLGLNSQSAVNFKTWWYIAEELKFDPGLMALMKVETYEAMKKLEQIQIFVDSFRLQASKEERARSTVTFIKQQKQIGLFHRSMQYVHDSQLAADRERVREHRIQSVNDLYFEVKFYKRKGYENRKMLRKQLRSWKRRRLVKKSRALWYAARTTYHVVVSGLPTTKSLFHRKETKEPVVAIPPTVGEAPKKRAKRVQILKSRSEWLELAGMNPLQRIHAISIELLKRGDLDMEELTFFQAQILNTFDKKNLEVRPESLIVLPKEQWNRIEPPDAQKAA